MPYPEPELDDLYRLIQMKLDAAHLLLHHPDKYESTERVREAGKRAREALMLSDSLQTANVSLDQKDLIVDSDEMAEIRSKFQRLILFCGAALFEPGDTRQAKRL